MIFTLFPNHFKKWGQRLKCSQSKQNSASSENSIIHWIPIHFVFFIHCHMNDLYALRKWMWKLCLSLLSANRCVWANSTLKSPYLHLNSVKKWKSWQPVLTDVLLLAKLVGILEWRFALVLQDDFGDLLKVGYCFNYVHSIYIFSKIVLYFGAYNFLSLITWKNVGWVPQVKKRTNETKKTPNCLLLKASRFDKSTVCISEGEREVEYRELLLSCRAGMSPTTPKCRAWTCWAVLLLQLVVYTCGEVG